MNRCEGRFLAGEFSVEPAGITWIFEGRSKGRCDSLVEHVVPIDVAEEGVRLYFLCISRAGTKSLAGIASE